MKYIFILNGSYEYSKHLPLYLNLINWRSYEFSILSFFFIFVHINPYSRKIVSKQEIIVKYTYIYIMTTPSIKINVDNQYTYARNEIRVL